MEYASDPLAEKLAVFAKHDMLGHLRQLMPKSLQERVIRQVPKNFLHLPAQELVGVFAREVRDGTDLS